MSRSRSRSYDRKANAAAIGLGPRCSRPRSGPQCLLLDGAANLPELARFLLVFGADFGLRGGENKLVSHKFF